MTQDNQPDFGSPFVPLTNNGVAGVVGYGNKVAPVAYSNHDGLVNRDHENISTKIGSVTLQHDFQNGVVFSNHTQYGSTYRDSILSAPRSINATTTKINHGLQSLDQTDTGVTNQADLTIRFATGAVRHTVLTGAEFSRETSVNYARGAYNPGTTSTAAAPLATTAGEQRVQGIESGATGKLTDACSVMAGYAHMDGKIVSTNNPLEVGQPLSSAPGPSANLWTTDALPFHMEIGGGATFVGDRVVNTTATRKVDGDVTLDAVAAFGFRHWSATTGCQTTSASADQRVARRRTASM